MNQNSVVDYKRLVDSDWKFSTDELSLWRVLGEDAFGKVLSIETNGIMYKAGTTTVAVKMLKIY